MVGIMNLDKQITSFLTVELITDCEIVRISADVLRKLAMENIEIALVCNRMQSVASMQAVMHRALLRRGCSGRYHFLLGKTLPAGNQSRIRQNGGNGAWRFFIIQ